MAGAPRVVVIDSIDPQIRATLLASLSRPIASIPARSGSGMLWGVLLLILGFVAMAVHQANLEGGSPPGDFYSPYTFGIGAAVAYLAGALIIGHVQRTRSRKRLPQQGTFISGANVIVATERVHTVYSFADLEKLEVISHQTGGGGLTLVVRIAGITWNFVYGDKRRAFEVEQAVKNNIARMDQAFQRADNATAMSLDPYAFITAIPATPKRPTSRWLLALAFAVGSAPIAFAVDYSADETSFKECKRWPQGHRCARYPGRGGRHDAEVRTLIEGSKAERGAPTP